MAVKNPSVNCFRKFKRLQLTFQVVWNTQAYAQCVRGVHDSVPPNSDDCPPPVGAPLGILVPLRPVAYLGLADNSRGPLLSCLRGLSPPVVRSRNRLSAPYAALLSCLSTHRSCLLTY